MERFDDWITDREVKLQDVRHYIDQPDLIGQLFLNKYIAATTSGTTGVPGIFLLDTHNRAVTTAWSSRMFGGWLLEGGLLSALLNGGRMAVVAATGAHFVVATTTAAIQKGPFGKRVAIFPAQAPLSELVDHLNIFRPAILSGYASLISLLAYEQEAGRLRISPTIVMPGSEGLGVGDAERIAKTFNAVVRTAYVATECLFMASGCKHGWLHVNSDWAILEPVDADFRPAPPGVPSHTVLVSNLANRVQPVIRYDLGDSVLERASLCPCGNPLPAIRVLGRTGELLKIQSPSGGFRMIAPLVLETVVDQVPGVKQFQLVQVAPSVIRVRLAMDEKADPELTWRTVCVNLSTFLSQQNAENILIERATEPPEYIAGRKYRTVIPIGDVTTLK
jgi:phenylacetate-coenzyme A ligase PaaK-like adenylate-forming protein